MNARSREKERYMREIGRKTTKNRPDGNLTVETTLGCDPIGGVQKGRRRTRGLGTYKSCMQIEREEKRGGVEKSKGERGNKGTFNCMGVRSVRSIWKPKRATKTGVMIAGQGSPNFRHARPHSGREKTRAATQRTSSDGSQNKACQKKSWERKVLRGSLHLAVRLIPLKE